MTYCTSCGSHNTGTQTQDNEICTNCGDTESLIFDPGVETYLDELDEIVDAILDNTDHSTYRLARSAKDLIDLIKEELE